jgi:hypothetical protein
MARICLAIDLSAIISAPMKKTPQAPACPLLNTGRYLHCLKRAALYPEITMQSRASTYGVLFTSPQPKTSKLPKPIAHPLTNLASNSKQ